MPRCCAWFRGDEPALLERTKGRGKVLWFTSACDRAWGDWPRGRMYLPMLHQMVGYVSGIGEEGRIRHETAGDARKPGIDRVATALVHVVNIDPLESETARCTPAEFADNGSASTLPEPAIDDTTRTAPAAFRTTALEVTSSGPGLHCRWPACFSWRISSPTERRPDGKGTLMSLATSEPTETKFLDRFEHVWASIAHGSRSARVCAGRSWPRCSGLTLLTAADFRLELPWNTRAAGLFACGGHHSWRFSGLRSSRRYAGGRSREPPLRSRAGSHSSASGSEPSSSTPGSRRSSIHTEGAAPSLVDALERETEIRCEPLAARSDRALARVWAVAALARSCPVPSRSPTARNPEWRIALEPRPSEPPAVHDDFRGTGKHPGRPGGFRADDRRAAWPAETRRRALYTAGRTSPERRLEGRCRSNLPDRGPASKRQTKLEKVEKPLDYRVVAGSSSSPTTGSTSDIRSRLEAFEVWHSSPPPTPASSRAR